MNEIKEKQNHQKHSGPHYSIAPIMIKQLGNNRINFIIAFLTFITAETTDSGHIMVLFHWPNLENLLI